MKPWLIALVVIVVIAVGVGGFFGGKAVGGGAPTLAEATEVLQSATPEEMQKALQGSGGTGGLFGDRTGTGRTGGAGAPGAGGAGGFVSGSVISQDSDSITVKLTDGSTKIVLVSGSTSINVSQTGTATDLAVGKDVTVTGSTNSDGSVTATRIQIGTLPRLDNGAPGGSTTTTAAQ
jgi:hypothetical protein